MGLLKHINVKMLNNSRIVNSVSDKNETKAKKTRVKIWSGNVMNQRSFHARK